VTDSTAIRLGWEFNFNRFRKEMESTWVGCYLAGTHVSLLQHPGFHSITQKHTHGWIRHLLHCGKNNPVCLFCLVGKVALADHSRHLNPAPPLLTPLSECTLDLFYIFYFYFCKL
jgi:hypothetical protein